MQPRTIKIVITAVVCLISLLAPTAHGALPFTIQLFGPAQAEGAITETAQRQWEFPGKALSANTKGFHAGYGFPRVKYARWVVIWTGNSPQNKLRLVHFDDGPLNIAAVCTLVSDGSREPRPQVCDVTNAINELIEKRWSKNLGFQVQGGSLYTLYESRLEMVFE